jgi:phytoene dehydrogenase-like protein
VRAERNLLTGPQPSGYNGCVNQEPDSQTSADARPEAYTGLAVAMFLRLAAMDEESRGMAWVQANKFEWPDALADLKPPSWDGLTDRQKRDSKEGWALWTSLQCVTSDFQRSRAWWKHALRRTDEQHDKWWKEQAA